ncbi:MAG: T9SS type A sorting domain-containing protein [Lewinellaceae bacterium]|nr:T9SS type A sorting domain-containing protein [Lewinellaceae bacterium]
MKNIIPCLFILARITASAQQAQQIDPIWTRTEITDGSLGNGRLPIVMVDVFHNVIVCADTYSPGPVSGFITIKYDPDGNQLWQRKYDTFATDLITSAAADAAGAIYAGGSSVNPFSGQSQFIVIKYSPDGDTLWQYTFGGIPGAGTYLSKILIDTAQDLLIFGAYTNFGTNESGLLAVKLDPDGNEIWNASYEAGDYGYGGLDARQVDDHIVFWGQNGSPEGLRFFAWQMDMEGNTLDTARTEPYSDYFWIGYHIDGEGSLYIGDNAGEYKVTKFSVEGTTQWKYLKPLTGTAPSGVSARSYSIITDINNCVYASGLFYLNDTIGRVGITTKLNPSGDLAWEHIISYDGFELIGPYKSNWLDSNLLLITGVASLSVDSNFYEYFLATYDQNGPVESGITDIAGRRNWPASIAPDGAYFYIAGKSDPENTFTGQRKHFLCKYAMDDLVNTSLVEHIGMPRVSQMKVSPNPFADRLSVDIHFAGAGRQGTFGLYDTHGRVVRHFDVILNKGRNTFEVNNAEALPAGMYMAILRTAETTFSARLIKLR